MMTTSEVLVERLTTGSKPGHRHDNHRVALVVEGGGMRGTVSAGMLIALDQLGMRDAFDFVVGTSAGAIAGAFFVTRKATSSVSMYYDELNQEPFLSKKRLMRLGPALDLHYLIYEAAPNRGLRFEEVSDSLIPLYATLTPVDPDNNCKLARVSGGAERAAAVLQATASLPVLGGDSKEVDEQLYVDGGLIEQIPWRSAIDLGATHVLVAPSRPVSGTEPRTGPNFLERLAIPRLIRSMHGPQIADVLATLPDRATEESFALRNIVDGTASCLPRNGSRFDGDIELIELLGDVELPDRLESSREVLVDAVVAGAEAAVAHFGLKKVSVEHRVVLNHPEVPMVDYRREQLAEVIRRRELAPEPLQAFDEEE